MATPNDPWKIVRKSDGATVSEGFDSKQSANDWLERTPQPFECEVVKKYAGSTK